MKILVVGGTSGLGLALAEHFNADGIGTRTGHAIPEHLNAVVAKSLEYDVVINCIHGNEQNELLDAMFEMHDQLKLKTYFITVGSMSWRMHDQEHSKTALFHWADSIILRNATPKHTLVNPAWLWNSKDDGELDRVSTEDTLKLFDFLIESSKNNSIINLVEIKGQYRC